MKVVKIALTLGMLVFAGAASATGDRALFSGCKTVMQNHESKAKMNYFQRIEETMLAGALPEMISTMPHWGPEVRVTYPLSAKSEIPVISCPIWERAVNLHVSDKLRVPRVRCQTMPNYFNYDRRVTTTAEYIMGITRVAIYRACSDFGYRRRPSN